MGHLVPFPKPRILDWHLRLDSQVYSESLRVVHSTHGSIVLVFSDFSHLQVSLKLSNHFHPYDSLTSPDFFSLRVFAATTLPLVLHYPILGLGYTIYSWIYSFLFKKFLFFSLLWLFYYFLLIFIIQLPSYSKFNLLPSWWINAWFYDIGIFSAFCSYEELTLQESQWWAQGHATRKELSKYIR